MKKIFKFLLLGAVIIGGSSCKKALDINENPNSPTTSTPDLVLAQALVGSASISNTYNLSLADLGGQRANAGGFGGFGSVVTYQWTNNDFSGLWNSSYDNAEDYQYIIEQTASKPEMANYTAIAQIMKSYAFSKLVDQFNDVPYTEAFKGKEQNFTPKYDKAEDVYKDLVVQLAAANKMIDDASAAEAATPKSINSIAGSIDPLFSGDMNKWKAFSNTVRLRLLIKMAGVPALQAFTTPEFAKMSTNTSDYLTDDALVNPGYAIDAGKRNPTYNSLAFLVDGTRPTTSRIATKWILTFYNGNKIKDDFRGKAIYQKGNNVVVNQLGDESANVPKAPGTSTVWYSGGTAKNEDAIGVAKGASQGQPLILAAESKFLQSEAAVRGYVAFSDASALFNSGIERSFNYLYKNAKGSIDASKIFLWKNADGTVDQTRSVAGDVAMYKTDNAGNRLVDFSLALTDAQKIEAIITQKYIALNMVNNDEAFNEFRRTGFPAIVEGSLVATETFASRQSTSSRTDKLPGRLLYPQSEFNLNPANVPAGINQFTSRIFWDLN